MPKVIVKTPESYVADVQEWPTINLQTLQKVVGGYIEAAFSIASRRKGKTITAYCNEEGRLRGLRMSMQSLVDGHVIVGPVVFVATDAEGYDVGLSVGEINDIAHRLGVHQGIGVKGVN